MITPITKRIGVVCLTIIAVATMFIPNVEFQSKIMVVLPIITGITALLDGGK